MRSACRCGINLIVALGLTTQITSCALFSDDDQLEQEEFEEEEFEQDEMADFIEDSELPHPKQPTAWNTKILVLTSPLPAEDKIESCQSQLRTVTENIKNEDQLANAKDQILFEIKQNIDTYHWCFYYSIMKIDDKLTNDNMDMKIQEKNTFFLQSMKAMWLLSMTLDKATDNNTYFKYLRKRYVQLSSDFFARDIDVFGPPLGKPSRIYGTSKPKSSRKLKPAGELDIE